MVIVSAKVFTAVNDSKQSQVNFHILGSETCGATFKIISLFNLLSGFMEHGKNKF
jgi:hypothetical protein